MHTGMDFDGLIIWYDECLQSVDDIHIKGIYLYVQQQNKKKLSSH